MAKKINQKKKINIKLSPGETYAVSNVEVFVHIIKIYNGVINHSQNEEDKRVSSDILTIAKKALELVYNGDPNDPEDEWQE